MKYHCEVCNSTKKPVVEQVNELILIVCPDCGHVSHVINSN